jgi:hypothetical protein
VFCVPSLPAMLPPPKSPSKPAREHSSQPPALDYRAPEWSSKPPPVLRGNELNEEGFCGHYFLEVVKTGTVLESIPLSKPHMSFGRLDLCDVICEHPSLSRFHTVLQYSNGDIDSSFPKGFYAYDLNSTHGTFINKKRIEGRGSGIYGQTLAVLSLGEGCLLKIHYLKYLLFLHGVIFLILTKHRLGRGVLKRTLIS